MTPVPDSYEMEYKEQRSIKKIFRSSKNQIGLLLFDQYTLYFLVLRCLLGPLRNSAGVNPDPNQNSNCSKTACLGSLIMVSIPGLMTRASPLKFLGLLLSLISLAEQGSKGARGDWL